LSAVVSPNPGCVAFSNLCAVWTLCAVIMLAVVPLSIAKGMVPQGPVTRSIRRSPQPRPPSQVSPVCIISVVGGLFKRCLCDSEWLLFCCCFCYFLRIFVVVFLGFNCENSPFSIASRTRNNPPPPKMTDECPPTERCPNNRATPEVQMNVSITDPPLFFVKMVICLTCKKTTDRITLLSPPGGPEVI